MEVHYKYICATLLHTLIYENLHKKVPIPYVPVGWRCTMDKKACAHITYYVLMSSTYPLTILRVHFG